MAQLIMNTPFVWLVSHKSRHLNHHSMRFYIEIRLPSVDKMNITKEPHRVRSGVTEQVKHEPPPITFILIGRSLSRRLFLYSF
jgi:hypothetical protein